jgi:hypothetical protein
VNFRHAWARRQFICRLKRDVALLGTQARDRAFRLGGQREWEFYNLPNSLLEIDGLRPRAAARIIDPNPSSSRFTAAQAGFFDLSQLGSRGRLCLAAAE